MTTETTDAQRWHRIWSHREELLRIARRRCLSMDDAEDAVHEAMLRASERPHLDDERLGAWLTTVTVRLCVDRYRQLTRDADARGHSAQAVPVPFDEAVCDRAEARWLARRSRELPPRQAEALWLKAEELDVGQVASKMGLSYRTTESLLARARRTLRRTLGATLVGVLWLLGRGRPPGVGGGTAQAASASAAGAAAGAGGAAGVVGVTTAAATIAVLGFVVPGAGGPDGATAARPGERPAAAPAARAVRLADTPQRPPAADPVQARTAGGAAVPGAGRSWTELLELDRTAARVPVLSGVLDLSGIAELPAELARLTGLPTDLPPRPGQRPPQDGSPKDRLPTAPSLPAPDRDSGSTPDAGAALEDGVDRLVPEPDAEPTDAGTGTGGTEDTTQKQTREATDGLLGLP